MPVTTQTTSANGNGALSSPKRHRTSAASSLERRRRLPWIFGGVLLILGCALAFGVASLRTATGQDVLAVTRSIPAGNVIEAGDLQVVKVPPTAGLTTVLASGEPRMVGQLAAVPLVAGTLLAPDDLGRPPIGAAGHDVVAVALKAGAYPPSLGSGDQVDVVPVAGDTSSAATAIPGRPPSVHAVVVSVDPAPGSSDADVVVSLQVVPSDAAEVATIAAAGDVALVELPPGSGS